MLKLKVPTQSLKSVHVSRVENKQGRPRVILGSSWGQPWVNPGSTWGQSRGNLGSISTAIPWAADSRNNATAAASSRSTSSPLRSRTVRKGLVAVAKQPLLSGTLGMLPKIYTGSFFYRWHFKPSPSRFHTNLISTLVNCYHVARALHLV